MRRSAKRFSAIPKRRGRALQGDNAKARTAYQDFLAAWKAADPHIPVLIAAKSEH
jgi:hypothetical protein